MEKIEKILSFIVEIEKLKGVQRKTKPVGMERYENSAEHSWHVCLTALMLKDSANDPVSIIFMATDTAGKPMELPKIKCFL